MTQHEPYVIRLLRLPDGMEMGPSEIVALPVEVVLENGEKVELGPPTSEVELNWIYVNEQEYIQAHREDFVRRPIGELQRSRKCEEMTRPRLLGTDWCPANGCAFLERPE